jgi:hypothetical protein
MHDPNSARKLATIGHVIGCQELTI